MNLHFISGCPDMQYNELTYLTVLYKQKKGNLLAIDTLTSKPGMILKHVKLYPKHKLAFLYEQNYLDHSDNRAIFLDLASNTIKRGQIPFQRMYSFPTTISESNTLQVVLGKNGSQKELIYQGLDSSFSVSKVKAEDFRASVVSGYCGAPVKNPDILRVVIDQESGDIKIPKTKKIEDRPSFGISIPSRFLLQTYKYANIVVKNDQFVVLELYYEDHHKEFIVFNTVEEQWSKLNIKGDKTRIQLHGEWVSASKALNNESLQRVSPGASYRKQKPDTYGPGFDVMTRVLELYYPGELFLYHIPSKREISLKTFEEAAPQGDSEVLLVEDSYVYYRVNDMIYRAPIVNFQKLGESKLLIKDERVPNIHWAFFSHGHQ